MKRVLLSVLGTILGLVALLSFKTERPRDRRRLPAVRCTGQPSTSPATTPAPSSSAPPGHPTPASTTTPSASASTPAATSKTYKGSAVQTRYGNGPGAVDRRRHQDHQRVLPPAHQPRRALGSDINSQAAPLLLQETLRAQSSNIDTISGATYTSEGYMQSLQSALDQAGRK